MDHGTQNIKKNQASAYRFPAARLAVQQVKEMMDESTKDRNEKEVNAPVKTELESYEFES
jgi:hypothetical protein